jgi:hypothetical protein
MEEESQNKNRLSNFAIILPSFRADVQLQSMYLTGLYAREKAAAAVFRRAGMSRVPS